MVHLREAVKSDMDLLYEWANDPVVRHNSFRSGHIPYDVHQKWFGRMMEDERVLQYILMDDDTPVGQIRLNMDADEAEVGYSVASQYRGQGFGRIMLRLVAKEVASRYPHIKRLVAKVKPDNIASNRLFESEGYDMEYLCYSLDTARGGIAD